MVIDSQVANMGLAVRPTTPGGGKPRSVVLVISDLEFGGAQRQVIELANNMDPNQFDVHVCSLADYVPLAEMLKHRSRLHVLRKNGKYDFTVVLRLASLLRQLNADIAHSFLFDAEIATRLAGRLARRPIVIGSERNCFEQPKKRHQMARWLTQGCNDLTIANSNAGADFNSRMLRQPRSRYRVVHNGVDIARFYPRDRGVIRSELGIGPDELTVGIFGSFKPQKNHLFFLRAAKRISEKLPNTRFVLVGDELYQGMSNSTEWKRKIYESTDELGLRNRCLFLGNRKDVERCYSACDVTALPSLYEGTPNVALESMACGVPVVATDVADNAYIIPDGSAGYIVPLGVEDQFVGRICLLLGNPQFRSEMSARARAWVEDEFSSQRLAEKTAVVYREALGLRRTGPSRLHPISGV